MQAFVVGHVANTSQKQPTVQTSFLLNTRTSTKPRASYNMINAKAKAKSQKEKINKEMTLGFEEIILALHGLERQTERMKLNTCRKRQTQRKPNQVRRRGNKTHEESQQVLAAITKEPSKPSIK